MNTAFKLTIASLAGLGAADAAFAHATFANQPVKPETTVVAALQIPHGCDGKATTEVQVRLPEGFVFAKPQPKPGWELEIIQGDYAKTYDNHGKKVSSGPVEIRWKNGSLPDAYYDTFVIQGKVSGVEGKSGLPFKTIQLCGTEGTVAWDEVATDGVDPHSLKSPAPVLKIAAATGAAADEHAGHNMGAADAAAPAGSVRAEGKVGDLAISAGYTRAMLPGQPVGGGFLTVVNSGAADDRLVAVESPVAAEVQLHEMAMENNVMKMRALKDGIPVPAGQTVELKPGGLHLMFMKVNTPFKDGDKVAVTLKFEKAGEVSLSLPVEPARPAK